ncbi:hypothetical protein HPHPA26_1607 [Helicobacter pylori Hp A-26]|uniref:Uncharacterized protein n=1 Tax=Helicobacter pylori Hp A-26 TaxID=992056 RepID=I9TX26_HELPX|nr:hypothetical protein HPHPA26_1607 [Helicobacter pylori Hp A-26]
MYLKHCSMKSFFFLSFGEILEFLHFLRFCLGGIGKGF